jgi:hypothetical protein
LCRYDWYYSVGEAVAARPKAYHAIVTELASLDETQ